MFLVLFGAFDLNTVLIAFSGSVGALFLVLWALTSRLPP
jgi:hypothetical protein